MKKIIILLLMCMLFSYTTYATELTIEKNGVSGEIIVKYDDEVTPLVLLEGKTMDLTVKIAKTAGIVQPKMFVSLYGDGKVTSVQIVDAVDTGTQYQFQTTTSLPSNLTNYTMKIFLWQQELRPISKELQLITVLHPVIYTYDINNRIQTISYNNKITTCTYDDNGNLTSKITEEASSMASNSITANTEITDNLYLPIQSDVSQEEQLTEDPVYFTAPVESAYYQVIDGVEVTTYNLALLDFELIAID